MNRWLIDDRFKRYNIISNPQATKMQWHSFEGFVLTIHTVLGRRRRVKLKLSSKYFLLSKVATVLSKRPAQKLRTTEQMLGSNMQRHLQDSPWKEEEVIIRSRRGRQRFKWKQISSLKSPLPLPKFLVDVVEQGPAKVRGEQPRQKFDQISSTRSNS